jgi:S-adenosylmethionine-diacylglycerol 3-amino-3-carboxypropyl transferase
MKNKHSSFFSRISYSFGNEDWRTERKALSIQPSDKVVCVTASGDRPLHLLLDPCQEIISVDLNPAQNYLLSLKAKALEKLNFDKYLSFLGGDPCHRRLETLEILEKELDNSSRVYWSKQRKAIDNGILFGGAVEKMLSRVSRLLMLLRGKKIQELFEFDDIHEQRKYIDSKWNTYLWEKSFQLSFNPLVQRLILNDPGLFAYLGKTINPGTYIFNTLHSSLRYSLAKNNPFLSLVLRGYVPKENYPPCLTHEGSSIIREQLHKLTWQTTDFISFLENQPSSSIDVFSLSDIASYMNESSFFRLMDEVYRTSRPGARFSIRQFMSDHAIPTWLRKHFYRNSKLEMQLEREETCFVYRFMVGTISK